jgi:hypothetical protein
MNKVNISDDPVKAILERLRNIPVKQNLKQLIAADQELFGPRKISKSSRAYSALCQIKEQRPSLITDAEFEILQKEIPDSIIKLQNQTFKNQILNLCCPYDEYPVLNFHHYEKQKCIVRCTTKQTNIDQYNLCAKDLGVELITSSKLAHHSQSIIKYTDNLPIGRTSYLPPELQAIFPDYVLQNIELYYDKTTREPIFQRFKRLYNAIPLIVRRNSINETYELKTDYDENQTLYKYILVLEPETNPNLKYIFVHNILSKFLFISDSKILQDFFKSVQKHSNANNNLFTLLNKILHLDIDLHNNVNNFLSEIVKNDFKIVLHETSVVGFVKITNNKDVFYITPRITIVNNDPGSYFKDDYVMKCIKDGTIIFPLITEYKLDKKDKYCYDIMSNKITGIFWDYNGTEELTMTQPYELDDLTANYKIFDTSSYINLLLSSDIIDYIKSKNKLSASNVLNKITKMMLKRFIYLGLNDNSDESILKEKFIKLLNDYNLLVDTETILIKKTSLLYDIYKSRINKKEYEKFLNDNCVLFDKESIDLMVFDIIKDEMKLNCDLSEKIQEKNVV